MKHFLIFILIFYYSISMVKSQTISNVAAIQDGDKVVITYNLECDIFADISVYVSEKGDGTFTGPLKSVTGDAGNNILQGSKTIVWNPLQDRDMILGDNIVFRIMGQTIFRSYTDSRDGKTYKTIKIGEQFWMAENMAYKTGTGCWAYDNDESNIEKYGYLYTWETANKVCPTGWHLPSPDEWRTLTGFLGGEEVAGGKLKESGTTHWRSPNSEATNEKGFTALPGGGRTSAGTFVNRGNYGSWWTTSQDYTNAGYYRYIRYDNSNVGDTWGKNAAFSVRCVGGY
jgi:uncharacterized protein (TIGR02145 family)